LKNENEFGEKTEQVEEVIQGKVAEETRGSDYFGRLKGISWL